MRANHAHPAEVELRYSIIYASKVHKDDLHVEPEHKLIDNEHITVHYHNNGVSPYTSSSNTSRYAKDHGVSNTHPAKKKCVVLIHHLISSRSACIVDNNVTYQRTSSTPIGGDQHIYVDQLSEHDITPYKQYILEK